MSVEEITLAKRIQMFEESSIYPAASRKFLTPKCYQTYF